ncbi:hypothetical protein BASA50_002193 [Batrachochytrium salamandrivorans]|uniref:Uncharacterized protein n=1 Tax=Batrachochytrium salamandrivorans TaxID=1357716 RepID=A0ABQ8FM51_9FUNG|nr:hypothetical protein BASA50_002193 [Batrachochytrium salamandrivorans]
MALNQALTLTLHLDQALTLTLTLHLDQALTLTLHQAQILLMRPCPILNQALNQTLTLNLNQTLTLNLNQTLTLQPPPGPYPTDETKPEIKPTEEDCDEEPEEEDCDEELLPTPTGTIPEISVKPDIATPVPYDPPYKYDPKGVATPVSTPEATPGGPSVPFKTEAPILSSAKYHGTSLGAVALAVVVFFL